MNSPPSVSATSSSPDTSGSTELALPPHLRCDCVPDLGPAHCHRCSQRAGSIVAWDDALCLSLAENPVYQVLLSAQQTEALVLVSEAFDATNGTLTAASDLTTTVTEEAGPEAEAEEAADVAPEAETTGPTPSMPVPAPPQHRYVSAIEHQAIRNKNAELHPSWPPMYEPFTENQTVPWTFTRLALDQLTELDIPLERVVDMMEGEHVMNPSSQGDATNHYGDEMHVLLDANGVQIISVLVRPTRGSYDTSGASVISGEGQPVKRKKSHHGGPGRTIPSSAKEFIALLDTHGFETAQGASSHHKATHADHPTVTIAVPSTPSDGRSFLNTVSDIKRLTGIDITRPAAK